MKLVLHHDRIHDISSIFDSRLLLMHMKQVHLNPHKESPKVAPLWSGLEQIQLVLGKLLAALTVSF